MNRTLLSSASVAAIMNKRTPVSDSHIGQKVVLTVQGRGNVIDVINKAGELVVSTTTGEILQKKIFNCKASSRMALKNERNRAIFAEGMAFEKAGDTQSADSCFVDFLNKTQLSFSVLLPSAVADVLDNGVDIAAKVQLIETENGSTLTLDPSTIAVKHATVITDSVNFNIEDFMPKAETKAPAPKAPASRAKAK